jgi:hypothetical protein
MPGGFPLSGRGRLRDLVQPRPAGVVLALQAPTREAVGALVRGAQAGGYDHFDVQILDWEFGGRR